MSWYVYMLRCADESLYTGVTVDLERRVNEHNYDDAKAARYTRARRPVTLVYQESCDDRASACQREHQLRNLPRREKILLSKTYAE